MPTPAIAACTGIAYATVTDRALRTRGGESLRSISGFALTRRAPNGHPPWATRERCVLLLAPKKAVSMIMHPYASSPGYMASIGQWVAFDERWKRVLQKHDVLGFHSKEFFPIDGRRRRVGCYQELEAIS
jgi:hypothetical protein